MYTSKKKKVWREIIVGEQRTANTPWIHKRYKYCSKQTVEIMTWMLSPSRVIRYDGWTKDVLMLGTPCQYSHYDIRPLCDPPILYAHKEPDVVGRMDFIMCVLVLSVLKRLNKRQGDCMCRISPHYWKYKSIRKYTHWRTVCFRSTEGNIFQSNENHTM